MSIAALSIDTPRSNRNAAAPRDDYVALEIEGVAWTMQANVVDQLLPRLRNGRLLSGRLGKVIKTGPHRTVFRLKLPVGDFYLKHFRAADWKALLQNVVRPSKAEREWYAVRHIAALGLPTFEPVAFGMLRHDGIVRDSFLVSRAIPDAIPLDEFVRGEFASSSHNSPACAAARRRSALRRNLASDLGKLTAQLHLAGVEHADFHSANILVRVRAGETLELSLIDLHKVRFGRTLSREQRYDNIALVHQFFAFRSSRTDRLRFYRAYQNEWQRATGWHAQSEAMGVGADATPFPKVRACHPNEIDVLEQRLALGALQGWRRADRAWKRGNRHVRKLDSGSVGCRGLAAVDASWLAHIRADPERLFRDRPVRWHKLKGKHRVAEVRLDRTGLVPQAILKCIEKSGKLDRWLSRFRMSRVRRAWEAGHALLRRGVDTPTPILYVECGGTGSRRDYLLTEAVADSVCLSDFLAHAWPELNPTSRRDWFAAHGRRLALQLRRLHDSNFDHRDLKFSNLLVANDPRDPRTWLVDLDGIRVWRWLPAKRAAQNLARVNVSSLVSLAPAIQSPFSTSDRLRFLKWYLGSKFSSEWKWWWRRIARASFRKLETNRRRGRPLS